MVKNKVTRIVVMVSAQLCGSAIAEPAASILPDSNHHVDQSVLVGRTQVDDREVYIVTSKLNGKFPKIGPMEHASIAICPKGVSPVVYECGVPVSNCRECQLYGTQVMERGFRPEKKRIGVTATKVCGITATQAECRIRNHNALNVPILNDCRHHVIQALGIRNRHGHLKRPITLK